MKYILFLIVLLLALPAFAQDPPIQTIPPGDDLIVPLRKGEPAPYDGQLFSTDTSIRWGFWLQQYKLRLKSDVEFEIRRCQVQLDFKDKELKIEKERAEKIEKDLFTRVQRSEEHTAKWQEEALNPSFFKTFEFGLIVGIAVTAGAAALLAWGLNKGS